MRVTKDMKGYIHDCVEKKVADRLAAAKKAHEEQARRDDKAVEAVAAYAKSLVPGMTEKVVAFAKKQGLTWLEHPINWSGVETASVNRAFSATVSSNDFGETNSFDANESPERKMRRKLEKEPGRIGKAVDKATNAIVFSLELGRVKKAELEELIASTEVEL